MTSYSWTDRQKADMQPGTPLVLPARAGRRHEATIVIFGQLTVGGEPCCYFVGNTPGVLVSLAFNWGDVEPFRGPTAQPLSAQERDLLDTRSADLGRVRAKLRESEARNERTIRANGELARETLDLRDANAQLRAEIGELNSAAVARAAHPMRTVIADAPCGQEAEELRSGLEELLNEYNGGVCVETLQALLDNVDARDSLAHLEANAELHALRAELHDREDAAVLVLSMGRELQHDAATYVPADMLGALGWKTCAEHYLRRYGEILRGEAEEPVTASPIAQPESSVL